jgi:hypothetical protein
MLNGEEALRAKALELAIRFWDMVPGIVRNEAFIRVDPKNAAARTDLLMAPIVLLTEHFLNYLKSGDLPEEDIQDHE